MPQGGLAIAAVGSLEDPQALPVGVAIIADAGKNEEKMVEVLNRSTKQAEDAGPRSRPKPSRG